MKTKFSLFGTFILFYFSLLYSLGQQPNQKLLFEGPSNCCPFLNSIILLMPDTNNLKYRIVIEVSTGNEGGYVNKKVTIAGNIINIEACYWEGTASTPMFYKDTFLIDELQVIEYTLNTCIYVSYMVETCAKYDSTNVTVNFTVDKGLANPIYIKDNLHEFIYPNPFNNYLYIQNISRNINIEIFDLKGKKILDKVVTKGLIDLNFLENGIYILKIDNNFFKIIKE